MTNSSSFPRAAAYVTANRFYVEMMPDASIVACFNECSGLGVTIEAKKISEGGVNDQQRILLGGRTINDITLKRGVTDDLSFWNWVTATTNRRRNIRILVFNQAGETKQCWTLIGAVAVGWKAPTLTADSTQVAMEEITIACEGLTVAATGGGAATVVTRNATSGAFPSS
ncbi:phage tail protein [Tumidithrix elongata RA019]|uniref:Phage tail protein n=1 Tax=Tumidithrix elongata BACA0141 TaxID=2716417 RepID=A0AAW9Q079_9CYAN|nr:phage tail protein [Tumidithrix elongata RA019]